MEKRKTVTSNEVKLRHWHKKRKALNDIAVNLGFDSWGELETLITQGKAKIEAIRFCDNVSRETIE